MMPQTELWIHAGKQWWEAYYLKKQKQLYSSFKNEWTKFKEDNTNLFLQALGVFRIVHLT